MLPPHAIAGNVSEGERMVGNPKCAMATTVFRGTQYSISYTRAFGIVHIALTSYFVSFTLPKLLKGAPSQEHRHEALLSSYLPSRAHILRRSIQDPACAPCRVFIFHAPLISSPAKKLPSSIV